MLNNLFRTGSLTAALVAGTLLGCSIGSWKGGAAGGEPAPAARRDTPCCLRFQDYTTIESLRELTDEQVFCLRRQALEAYREERRWALFLGYPNSKMLLPDDSPFGDMPWDEAFTDEAKRLRSAALVQADGLESTLANYPDDRRQAELDIVFAAKQWDEINTARRKLSRDILEKVYRVHPGRSGPYDLDDIYSPPAPPTPK